MLTVLPLVCGDHQEMRLITELNNFFDFDHNIFLLDSTIVDPNLLINTTDFTPKSVFVGDGDNVSAILKIVISKRTFLVVAPTTEFARNLEILHKVKKIQTFQKDIKIGIFFRQFASNEYLEALFAWCKKMNIFNIFATNYRKVVHASSTEMILNCFTFPPFGELYVTNLTGVSYQRYFASLNPNYHQHRLNVTSNAEMYSEEVWRVVLDLMNATFMEVDSNSIDVYGDLAHGIDIHRQLYPQEYVSHMLVYPMEMCTHIILVPEASQYSGFAAYLQTVTSDEFFGYSLLTIIAVTVLLCIFRYREKKKNLIFQSIADVLNLLANDNGYIKYQRLSRIESFLIVPLTFVGWVAVNGLLSTLQSYLTRPVYQPQIKTFEDVYRSELPILAGYVEWKDHLTDLLTNETTFTDWSERILVTDALTYAHTYATFNTSTSFFMDTNTAEIIVRAQKHMGMRGYYITQTKAFIYHVSYSVSDRFIFVERLNDIIHRIQSAGLYILWRKQTNNFYERYIYGEYAFKTEEITADDAFGFPMFIVYGWLAAVIVFVVEIIWKKCKI